MSKSGLYAHFGSKEELQLATIDTAEEIYGRDVYDRHRWRRRPGSTARSRSPTPHLDHMRRRVFPGLLLRCRGRRPRARAGHRPRQGRAFQEGWVARLRENLEAAVANGELPPDARPRPADSTTSRRTSSSRTRGSCSTATTAGLDARRRRSGSASAGSGPGRQHRAFGLFDIAHARVRRTSSIRARSVLRSRTPHPLEGDPCPSSPGRVRPAARHRGPRRPPRLRREARSPSPRSTASTSRSRPASSSGCSGPTARARRR